MCQTGHGAGRVLTFCRRMRTYYPARAYPTYRGAPTNLASELPLAASEDRIEVARQVGIARSSMLQPAEWSRPPLVLTFRKSSTDSSWRQAQTHAALQHISERTCALA